MRLRHKDWKKLFGAVAQLYSDFDPETLRDRALTAAEGLVPGEIPAFNFFEATGEDTREYWHGPDSLPTRAELEIFPNVAHEHPLFPEVFGKGRRDTMTIGDFLSPAEFRSTAIYNEFYRLFPIHHQMSVALSLEENLVATYSINRNSADFTDEERLMFDLIAPHMANAIRNGRKLQRLLSAEANLNSILETKSSGIIALGVDGTIEYISQFARSLVEKYFGHRAIQQFEFAGRAPFLDQLQ